MTHDVCRVLFVSIGYVPYATPSDKQFVHDLLAQLDGGVDAAIWALNDEKPGSKEFLAGNRRVRYRNANRLFHRPLFASGNYRPHPTHSNVRNGLEIGLSLFAHLSSIESFAREFRPDVVHFTDTPGPISGLLRFVLRRTPITITKPTIQIRRDGAASLYRNYVKASVSPADKIVTFTRAAKRELCSWGIPDTKVEVLPWGVNYPAAGASEKERGAIRRRYGCGTSDLLIVVTDRLFGQELKNMLEAIKATPLPDSVRFVVAIRPTRYEPDFASWSSERLIVEKGPPDYYALLEAADALLSPEQNYGTIHSSLIPLAWLEAMARGTPVIARPAPGVEDVIADRETGFFLQSIADLVAIVDLISDAAFRQRVQSSARTIIERDFCLAAVARKYAHIWRSIKRAGI